jgi:hypothetical protein
MEESTPADLRQKARDALVSAGTRRKRAIATVERIEQELRPLVIAAHRNEVPYRTIRDLTGLSQTTIRKWTKDAE